ncbi:MAG: hypothetical protein IAE82_18930 [Opitutaceae bacterium]|nr:hypothetical protein [Opitutaceae bacterium]
MQITKSTGTRKNLTTAALVVVALLPLAALSCRSGPAPRDEPAVRQVPPAPLIGEGRLAEGTIRVKATVAMDGMAGPGGGRGGQRPPGGGGMPPAGGMGGPPPVMAGGGSFGGGGAMGASRPSHALSVVFTNTGDETVEFAIVDVTSRLGNFRPQPDALALAPGQSGALYPMRGSLAEDVAELQLTVTIRTKDGRTDTGVITLTPDAAPSVAGGA